MTTSEVVRPEGSAFELLKAATDAKSRFEAGHYALGTVTVPGVDNPIPRFFFDLPWAESDEGAFDAILAQLAGAENIEEATHRKELRKLEDVIGQPATILGVVARQSDVEDSKWGAYLSLTVSVDGGEPEVINSGNGEVCVTAWRLYCEGRLPAQGVFVHRGEARKGRSQPIGFQVEGEL